MFAFNIAAGIASLVGAILSALAFWHAKRASEAAQEARKAIIVSTTADELATACVRAEELRDYLSHRRYAEAIMRANELVSSLSELAQRRRVALDAESRDALQTVRLQLHTIIGLLPNPGDADPDRESLARILKAVRNQVVVSLRETLGKIRGAAE